MFQHEVLYRIIDHKYYQRLRRITQQALSHYVYPGAMHTRFQHALGVCHLTTKALEVIKSKGHPVTDEESAATCIAALLHDIGHGPFSHALENAILDLHHEEISLLLMEKISKDISYDFNLAIRIFKGEYHRPFLNQLVSSQLDVDRMDYLMRDSFYSGVAEGIIGYDRIIMMMNVFENQLVIEEKGLHSIEKFLMARRLMYHQVYLHKTVVSAETMLTSILKRAKYLVQNGFEVVSTSSLNALLSLHDGTKEVQQEQYLAYFTDIDDADVLNLIKEGRKNSDPILSFLCNNLLERKLFKLSLHPANEILTISKNLTKFFNNKISNAEVQEYLLTSKNEIITYYDKISKPIYILTKDQKLKKYDKCVGDSLIFPPQRIDFKFTPFID